MIRYSGDRFLNIELVTNTQTGLKIPLSSIVKKNFYVIPKEYIATDEEDGNAGFYRKVTRRGKDDSSEFVKATIYQEDDDYYYVDMDTFQDGDVILKPDSQSVYEIKEKKASFLPEGQVIRGHEFHYFDSEKNGEDCIASKPVSGKTYPCILAGETYWMGFPHLYYPSNPAFARNFVEKAAKRKGVT